jgi:hypothetical protein
MRFGTLLICFALAGTQAARAHEDVTPYALNGKIVTGGHDDALGTDHLEQRVFGYDFGEDPSDPYFIGDPGFNNGAFTIGVYPGDGLLPANFTLRFELLTNLNYWDGIGAVSWGAPPPQVSLGLQRGSNTVTISGSGASGTVPTIASTGASGRVHVHLGSLLNSSDGIDPLGPNAPDGIYMVGLELMLPGSGLANSESIYFVYNNNLDEAVHDLAIAAIESSLAVPEPSTYALGLAALAVLFPWRCTRAGRYMSFPHNPQSLTPDT